MNTPSHWLMTVAIGKIGPWKNKVPKWSLGLGSLAPDLPLYLLSLGGIVYFSVWKQWPAKDTFPHMYDPSGLFFNDPGWIAFHNLFHSPTSLLILFAMSRLVRTRWPRFCRWFQFFLAACALHSFVDILTHNDDGPLLFFPFEWTTKFISPVSYWDSDHYGFAFMRFEVVLDVVLVVFLVCSLFAKSKNKRSFFSSRQDGL